MSGQPDYRDGCIEQLADDLAEREAQIARLADRAVTAAADCSTYRLLAVQTLHYCHALHTEHLRLTEQNQRLREEVRSLRANGMLASMAQDARSDAAA